MKESVKESSALYKTLDAWRGLASLWVTWFHVCHLMLEGHVVAGSALVLAVSGTGYLGVQMFFVISGYCNRAGGLFRAAAAGALPGICGGAIAAHLSALLDFAGLLCGRNAGGGLSRAGRDALSHSAMAETDLLHQSWRYYVVKFDADADSAWREFSFAGVLDAVL